MKTKTVAFAGTLRSHIGRKNEKPQLSIRAFNILLDNLNENLYKSGYRRFLCGMARGFDLLAAESVLRLKNRYDDMQLVAVIPYDGFETRYNRIDKLLSHLVIDTADARINMPACQSHAEAEQLRDEYLVQNSDTLVCCYGNGIGSVSYPVICAARLGIKIINLGQ